MQYTAVDGASLIKVFRHYPSVFWEVNLHVGDTVDLHPLIYVGTHGVLIVPSFGILQDSSLPEAERWKELFDADPGHSFRPLPHPFLFEPEVWEVCLRRSRIYLYDVVGQRKVPTELQLHPQGYTPIEKIPGLWVGYAHAFMPGSYWPVSPQSF